MKTVVFCQGKVYYDLLEKKEELGRDDHALVRIEQLHPLPVEQLQAVLKRYAKAERHLWVQEEPENMGAWPHPACTSTAWWARTSAWR